MGCEADTEVERLARHDESVLWPAADRVLFTDAVVFVAAEAAVRGTAEEADVIEELEARHGARAAAEDRLALYARRSGRFVFAITAAAAIGYGIGNETITFALLGCVAAALLVVAVLALLVLRLRVREQAALKVVGARSYLIFHLRRVDALLDAQAHRQRLGEIANARVAARAEWQHLAGDATVQWALANRHRIRTAHRQTEQWVRELDDHVLVDLTA
jgi:hypothetical protein